MSDTLQASIAIASIKVNGSSVGTVERDLEEIVIDTSYHLPSMATIRLHDPKLKWADSEIFKIGDKLSITLGPSKSMKEIQPGEVFLGEIVALEPSFSSQGTSTFTVRAYDISHRLHVGTKTRTFLKMNDTQIVKKIAQEAGLQAGTMASSLPENEYVIQPNMTDFEFLSLRARRAGCLFSVVQGKINFHEPGKMKTGPTLEMGETLREFSIRMSAARQANKIVVRGWSYRTKKAVEASVEPKATWNQNGVGRTGGAVAKSALSLNSFSALTTLAPRLQAEADMIANAMAADQEGAFTEADGVAFGHPGLVAGVQVELKFLGSKYSGKYYVTSATHIYNSAGYETHFTVSGRYPQSFNQLLNGNSTEKLEPWAIHGVVIGLVTNVKDPDNMGRVKVTFPWLDDAANKNESNWARIASPMAGKERGFFFLPEVNDEVLVAFEHGNPNHPYIVGVLWNGQDKPPETNSAAHTGEGTIHRMLVTRSGHKVIFDDSNSKKSVTIVDATGEQSIFFDSVKKKVEIKSGGDMLIDVKGNLDVKVMRNITVEAQANIKVTGVNVEVIGRAMIKLDAKAALEMKGAGSFKLESTGPGTVEGSLLNISAKGPMVVAGKPIALN